jgi:hypothetical protein
MDAQIQIQAVFLQPINPANAKYLASKPSQEKIHKHHEFPFATCQLNSSTRFYLDHSSTQTNS